MVLGGLRADVEPVGDRAVGEALAEQGEDLSNRAIADGLYISPKTAEHHVGRILGKLGLRSRAEAAAHAARGGAG